MARIFRKTAADCIYAERRIRWAAAPNSIRDREDFRELQMSDVVSQREGQHPVRKHFSLKQSEIRRHDHQEHCLTPREREILHWIAHGKSNAQIGEILRISTATVSKHLEHIYPKLGVENRTAAASFAFELETKRSPPPERPVGPI